jgi:NADH-quinone oxidoreductase subunit L
MLKLIWLIPLLPLVGVVINALIAPRTGRENDKQLRTLVGLVACGTVGLAFVIAIGAVWGLAQMPHDERFYETSIATWMPLGAVGPNEQGLTLDWGFALDPLSAVLLLVVTGVGFLIHVYSVGYMSHEADYARFFVYLNLFMGMMLTLVLANNLAVLFVGWEGVGLCSYLLIGFFYDKPFDDRTGLSCADAGRKAFIVNRIGDFAFLIAMLYLILQFGTLNFRELNEALGTQHVAGWFLAGVGILMFIGAAGKSAQIPLYVWLPDAMAGPTPVSALIHAATMVTAGVYMVCRMSALYSASPEAMAVVATVGAATAVFAATMGITATDIKKVLAYSTVSQLGYMFAAAGVGAYIAAMFHLMTHAFFKALLFLGAGSVIHGLHGEQDIRRMGGMQKLMPTTHWTFLVATCAIAGVPLLSGFFSKDEILWGAWASGNKMVWGMLAFGAGITAFYMFRLWYLVFRGEFRGTDEQKQKAHESPLAMTLPLMILAVLSIGGGWIGIPKAIPAAFGSDADPNVLHHWMEPAVTLPGHGEAHDETHAAVEVSHEAGVLPAAGAAGGEAAHSTAEELGLMGLAILISVGGIVFALLVYRRSGAAESLAVRLGPVYRLLRNLYWVDELYEAAIVRPFYRISQFFAGFDRWVVDGLVNAAGVTADITGQVIKLFQTGFVRNYALMFLFGVIVILIYLVGV